MRLSWPVNTLLIGMLSLPSMTSSAQPEANTYQAAPSLNLDTLTDYVQRGNLGVLAERERVRVEESRVEELLETFSQLEPFAETSVFREDTEGEDLTVQSIGAGLSRAFFNGADLRVSIGGESDFAQTDAGYVDIGGSIPIGASPLLVARESAMTNARRFKLDADTLYAQTLAWEVWFAQRAYFTLIASDEGLRYVEKTIDDLNALPTSDAGMLVQNEIATLKSRLSEFRAQKEEAKLSLAQRIGGELPSLAPFDFYDSSPVRHYLDSPFDDLLGRAETNDLQLQILSRALEAAETKRELTEEARLDVRISGSGRLYAGDNARAGDYQVVGGISVRFPDRDLRATRLEGAAREVQWLNYRIEAQKTQTAGDLRVNTASLKSLAERSAELARNAESREDAYNLQVQGNTPLKDIVDLRLALLDEQLKLRDTQLAFWHTSATLYRLSGEATALLHD